MFFPTVDGTAYSLMCNLWHMCTDADKQYGVTNKGFEGFAQDIFSIT